MQPSGLHGGQVPGVSNIGASGVNVVGVAGNIGPQSVQPYIDGSFSGSGQYHHLGVGMRMQLDMQMEPLAAAVVRAYGYGEAFVTAATVNERAARGLRNSIQKHTPIGPSRDLTGSKAQLAGASGTGKAMGNAELLQELGRRKIGGDQPGGLTPEFKALGKEMAALANMYHNSGGRRGQEFAGYAAGAGITGKALSSGEYNYEAIVDHVATKRGIEKNARSGGGRGGVASAPGDPNGSLFESIDVRATGDGPNSVMMAKSLSYYGWFVEVGARRVLKPRMPLDPFATPPAYGSNNVTWLPLARIGNYGYFSSMIDARDGGVTIKGDSGQAEAGSGKTPTIMFEDVGSNGENEGFHFIERGVEDFMKQIGLQMDGVFNRGLQQVWNDRASVPSALKSVSRRLVVVGGGPTQITGFGNTQVWRGAGGKFTKAPGGASTRGAQ